MMVIKKKKRPVNAKAFVYSAEISNITELSMLDNYETWDLCTAKSKKDPKTGQTWKSLNDLWRLLSLSNCYWNKLR